MAANPKTAPEPATNPAQAPNIRWDESGLQTSFANFCNVLGTREELAMLFGTTMGWNADRTELTVKVQHRILMNPYATKRLMLLLQQGIQEYETRYGELKLD